MLSDPIVVPVLFNKETVPRFFSVSAGVTALWWVSGGKVLEWFVTGLDASERFLAEKHDWATVRAQAVQVAGPTFSVAANSLTTCVTRDVANSTSWTPCATPAPQWRTYMQTLACKKRGAIFSLLRQHKSIISCVYIAFMANTIKVF